MIAIEGEDEQERAVRILRSGRSAFLTGPAGTGKSYVVRRFIEACETDRRPVLVTATTGVAAMILGGQTLHSATGLPVIHDKPATTVDWDGDDRAAWKAAKDSRAFVGAEDPDFDAADFEHSLTVLSAYKNNKRFAGERLRRARVLIVDETSMLDARALDHVSWLCAHARHDDRPFGGLQVVFVGDLAQLPPVEGERWGWAPDSAAWRALRPEVLNLTKIRRQSDPTFTELLGRLRFGRLMAADARVLLGRVGAFDPRTATRILPTNRECDAINARELASLPGTLRVSVAIDEAKPGREFLLKRFDEGCPSPKELRVKEGARVLITVNDELKPARYANGTAGVLRAVGVPPFGADAHKLEEELAVEQITEARTGREAKIFQRHRSLLDVIAQGETPLGADVELESGEHVWLGRHTWTIEERQEVVASRSQYPMRLGWAITAHRAQGATLARASVSLEKCFTEGQAYVALSRVKAIEGLNLETARLGVVAAHPRFLAFERERAASQPAPEPVERWEDATIPQWNAPPVGET